MKNWNFKVQGSPQEIIAKLESELASAGGFIFNADAESAFFKIRKPVKYPDQILHRNRIIVNGKIVNKNSINVTDVEIYFAQDFYMKMTVFSIIVFCVTLIVLISRASSGAMMFLLGGIVLFVGIVLWIALQKKLERDSQKYRTLISEILVPQ